MHRRNSKTRTIAPRLLDGSCRVPFGHGLPARVKAGLFAIAALERQSVSWVLEQVLIHYFKLPKPAYKPRKGTKQVKSNTRSTVVQFRQAASHTKRRA